MNWRLCHLIIQPKASKASSYNNEISWHHPSHGTCAVTPEYSRPNIRETNKDSDERHNISQRYTYCGNAAFLELSDQSRAKYLVYKRYSRSNELTFSLPTARPMRLIHSMVFPRSSLISLLVALLMMYLRHGMNLQQQHWWVIRCLSMFIKSYVQETLFGETAHFRNISVSNSFQCT